VGGARCKHGEWAAKKPDLDNLLKAVMDSLTAIGAWTDDSRVVQVLGRKQYATWAEPGAEVLIWTMDEADVIDRIKFYRARR
jgi:Holliday junction resolvase RusA-like endonuclease